MITTVLICLSLAGTPIHEQSPDEITVYLQQFERQGLSFEQRLHQVANDSIGMEYNGGPLGEGGGGEFDTDPLVDLTRADCVTFVEQSVALSVSPNYATMVERLQDFRYRDGRINYENRNHFMISDWIRNSPYCVDITTQLGVQTTPIKRTISRKAFFQLVKAPDIGQDTPDEIITLPVVPPILTPQAEAQLPDIALIVFVGKVDWLFALHCGLYLRDKNGEGYLIHASSKAESVTKTRLSDYMKQQEKRYVGFTAYAMTEPKEEAEH
jgi:hypothetical protein